MPNRNAYLCVDLGPAALDGLAELAAALAREAGGPEHFRAMDREQAHMTFFFAGEQLGRLSPVELASFHAAASTAVGQFQTDAASSTTLQLQGLALFPPEKRNLIVAQFAASPALHALQAQVGRLAAAAGVCDPGSVWYSDAHEQTDNATAAAWQPHVTLGKLRSNSDRVETDGGRLLKAGATLVAESAPTCQIQRIVATGIDLRGVARLGQRWLDWDLWFALPEPEPEPEPQEEAVTALESERQHSDAARAVAAAEDATTEVLGSVELARTVSAIERTVSSAVTPERLREVLRRRRTATPPVADPDPSSSEQLRELLRELRRAVLAALGWQQGSSARELGAATKPVLTAACKGLITAWLASQAGLSRGAGGGRRRRGARGGRGQGGRDASAGDELSRPAVLRSCGAAAGNLM
jgi:2'-5' RNA ligase